MGKIRLSKFYEHYTPQEQQQLIREIYQQLSKRSDFSCNFLETPADGKWGKETKIIYRHYATLYFVFVVDPSESELDLIFRMDMAHFVLDEIVMGGMVLETNLADICESVQSQNNLQAQEDRLSGIKNVIEKVQR